ncbi:MAG TPA: MFS transporter [Bryobacteraceae bacterium]|nr:MFS transporter [Bryobacteraceae bacterium]
MNRNWIISVAAVIVAMMAIQMASLGFSPLLPEIQQDLGASYSQIGLFTGMYGIIALLVSLPAGVFAARIGEKRALLIGLAVTAAGLAALSQATHYDVALAFRALWLIGYRTAFIGVFTAMAMVTPEKYRSRTMGILGAMAAFASVIGAPFGTRVAAWLGWRGGIQGYAAITLLAAIVFGLLYHRLSSPRSSTAVPHGAPITREGAVSALRNPIIWSMILLGLINMGGFSVTFFVPYAVKSVFGMGAQDAASIISASYLVSIPLNLGFGYLCDRYSRWNMMIWLAVLLVPASFAVMSRELLVFRIAVALIVSLGHAATNQIYAIGSSLLPKEEVGKGMGIVGLGSGIFGYLGPQMLGYLRDATGGFTAGWVFVACAAVLALGDLLILRRYSLKRRALYPEEIQFA